MKSSRVRTSAALVIAFLCCGFVGALTISDYMATKPDTAWPLTKGTVIGRSSTTVAYLVKRPTLLIRVEPDGPEVHATLMMSVPKDIPSTVTFRFSGDPSREVVLLEERSSLVGVFLALGLAMILAVAWLRWR